jgi:hypothetical protein
MLSKPFWVIGFVSLALGATIAQDPTKVEPTHYELAFEMGAGRECPLRPARKVAHARPSGRCSRGSYRRAPQVHRSTWQGARGIPPTPASPDGSRHSRTEWRTWAIPPTTRSTLGSRSNRHRPGLAGQACTQPWMHRRKRLWFL